MGLAELFSNENYPRLRAYTILIVALITGGAFVNNRFGSDQESAVHVKDDGCIIVGNCSITMWAHSANVLWEKSPVKVNKDDEISIIISGSYIDRIDDLLTQQNKENSITASGIKKKGFANEASKGLIQRSANYGQLLLQVVEEGYRPKVRPSGDNVYKLNDGVNKLQAKESGVLWFTTNQCSVVDGDTNWINNNNNELNDSLTLVHSKKSEPDFDNNFGQLMLQIVVNRNKIL